MLRLPHKERISFLEIHIMNPLSSDYLPLLFNELSKREKCSFNVIVNYCYRQPTSLHFALSSSTFALVNDLNSGLHDFCLNNTNCSFCIKAKSTFNFFLFYFLFIFFYNMKIKIPSTSLSLSNNLSVLSNSDYCINY